MSLYISFEENRSSSSIEYHTIDLEYASNVSLYFRSGDWVLRLESSSNIFEYEYLEFLDAKKAYDKISNALCTKEKNND